MRVTIICNGEVAEKTENSEVKKSALFNKLDFAKWRVFAIR